VQGLYDFSLFKVLDESKKPLVSSDDSASSLLAWKLLMVDVLLLLMLLSSPLMFERISVVCCSLKCVNYQFNDSAKRETKQNGNVSLHKLSRRRPCCSVLHPSPLDVFITISCSGLPHANDIKLVCNPAALIKLSRRTAQHSCRRMKCKSSKVCVFFLICQADSCFETKTFHELNGNPSLRQRARQFISVINFEFK